MANDQKTYVPKQKVTRGKPGYKGGEGLVIVDPDTGKQTPTKKKGD